MISLGLGLGLELETSIGEVKSESYTLDLSLLLILALYYVDTACVWFYNFIWAQANYAAQMFTPATIC